jgi:hypothetical protein
LEIVWGKGCSWNNGNNFNYLSLDVSYLVENKDIFPVTHRGCRIAVNGVVE